MFRGCIFVLGLAVWMGDAIPAVAQTNRPSIEIGAGASAAQGAELDLIISAPSEAIADDLINHFASAGFTCEMAQQGTIWVIIARRPSAGPAELDSIRPEAQAYVIAKGGTFNGGGIGSPGAIQIHRGPLPPADNGTGARQTQISAGAMAVKGCLNAHPSQVMELLNCVVPKIAMDGTEANRDKAEFALGANLASSFIFDALYGSDKEEGRTPQVIEAMRKIALANYKNWDQISQNLHLSDSDIEKGLGLNSNGDALRAGSVTQLRREMERLKSLSQ